LPALKKAAKRYSPEALLIGSMDATREGTKSQWLLVLGNNKWNWTVVNKRTDNVIASLLNQVTQVLAKNYLVKMAEMDQIWISLEVINITKRDDLTQLMQYLKQLTPVREVRLLQVSGDVIELSVRVRGSLAAFKQVTSISQHLDLKAQDRTGNKLYYAWH
jgi:hypothetical protein